MPPNAANGAYNIRVPAKLVNGGYWTIDTAPNPPGAKKPGYLGYVRMCKCDAAEDSTAREVVENLLGACDRATAEEKVHLNVVGHGEMGKIHTGSGGNGIDSKLYISSDNVAQVCKPLRKLRGRAGSLRLWSCNTGAGDDGATLLAELAEILHCDCYAPTGLIKCFTPCRFALQTGTRWLHAVPGKLPRSVSFPTIAPLLIAGEWTMAVSASVFIKLDDVLDVRIARRDGVRRHLEGHDAKFLLQKVDVAQPQILVGGLGAAITARFELTYKTLHAGGKASKAFLIYHDRIVMCVEDTTYYWCAEEFMSTAFA